MDDSIGRVFSYILIGFGLFVLAPILLLLNSDIAVRSYIQSQVTEFTDAARETGRIQKGDYDRFITKLNTTGNTYIIRMEHKQKVFLTDEDEYYISSYNSFNNQDIFAVLDGYGEDKIPGTADDIPRGEDYLFSAGDLFSVSVTGYAATPGSRFLGIFTGQPAGLKIQVSSGGITGEGEG